MIYALWRVLAIFFVEFPTWTTHGNIAAEKVRRNLLKFSCFLLYSLCLLRFLDYGIDSIDKWAVDTFMELYKTGRKAWY